MIEAQTLPLENLDEGEPITFTPREWKIFKQELDYQLEKNKSINILKALRNARYLAEIDRGIERMKAGHYVEHDIIEVDDDE